jgi:N,N'-diacetyllegionaminate synthase
MKLIAEIGQVHEGSLGLALNYIDQLSKYGVSIVKFQMHLSEYESSEHEKWRVPFSLQDSTRQEYWRRTGFSFDEWKLIAAHCQK